MTDLEALDRGTNEFLEEALRGAAEISPQYHAAVTCALKEAFGNGFRAGLKHRDQKPPLKTCICDSKIIPNPDCEVHGGQYFTKAVAQ